MMEIFIGIICGVIAAFGMGGGALLIAILSNFCNIDQHIAQSTNLIFFIPTSLCAVIVNSKNRNTKFKLGMQIVIFAIIGAIFGAILSNKLDKNILKKIFGSMLLIMAILEIWNYYKLYIKEKIRHNKHK